MEVQMEQIADILSLDPVLFLSNQKAEALIWQSFSLKGKPTTTKRNLSILNFSFSSKSIFHNAFCNRISAFVGDL